ncbi:endoglucanase E-4-like [Lineus longissimus]|uniref:endoglucanase E-4-like n=1 Tax=Lineus longissimus TaxID=88925 RepID=UPI00315DBE35
MANIIVYLVFAAAIAIPSCKANNSATFAFLERWHGGFKAQVKVTVSGNYNGWTLSLSFDEPVYSVQNWVADLTSVWSNFYGFEFRSNTPVWPGYVIDMIIIGDAGQSGVQPKEIGVKFNEVVILNGGQFGGSIGIPVATTTPTVTIDNNNNGKYNYVEALEKSILFYEAQRSGKLPPDNRVPWRGDSALGDGSDVGKDLTGGWYDAGDTVKFNFPMAWSTTTLIWGLLQYRDAYKSSGQYNWMLKSVRWPLEYFVKCHVSDNELYGQVGNGHTDHASWIPAEGMTMNRPSYKIHAGAPGSDLAGETAAAMAAGYLVFRDEDPAFAATLLDHAKRLYAFADGYRGYYSQSIPDAQSFYGSTDYTDELCWAAAWLYLATNDAGYLAKAQSFYDSAVPWAFSWADKQPGYMVLLAQITGDDKYKQDVAGFLNSWSRTGGGVTYTPKGLAWRDAWGSLRYSGNAAFIALMAADLGVDPSKSRDFARSQIHYALGDTGRSYVVGYGYNPPQRCHHKGASCPQWHSCGWNYYNSGSANVHTIYGALVGGPDKYDGYSDDRTKYEHTEVACDYNAGYQGALAGLIALANGK